MLRQIEKQPELKVLWHKHVLAERSNVYSKWTVLGELMNASRVPIEDVRIIAEFYGTEGKVIGLSGYSLFDKPIPRIEPGQKVPFSLEATIPSCNKVHNTKIVVESRQHTPINCNYESAPSVNPKRKTYVVKGKKRKMKIRAKH